MSAEQDVTTASNAPDDAPEIVSAFPLPPAFFALYSDGVDSGPAPPAPMEPQYHMFGTPFSTQDVVPDLLPMPGKKLYVQHTDATASAAPGALVGAAGTAVGSSGGVAGVPAATVAVGGDESASAIAGVGGVGADLGAIDFKKQMKKINRSLLANFTELVDVLTRKPSLFNEKLDDLELLFLNMHNLINAFRPHQARETIIHMLQMQIQERRDAAHEIRKTIDEARRTVEDVHGQLHDHVADELTRSQDADIKMEDADASSPATDTTQAAASAQPQSSSPHGGAGGDLSVKSKQAQQMQDSFFAALLAVSAGGGTAPITTAAPVATATAAALGQ